MAAARRRGAPQRPLSTPGAIHRLSPGRERTLTATATVAAPMGEVWALATDPGRFAEWGERTLEVTRADRPLGIGSTYEERSAVLGPVGGRSRWTVVAHDPPHRWTHRGEGLPGLAALDAFCELRAVENATEITLGLRYRPALGAVGALVDRAYGRRATEASLRRSVDALAALATRETGSAAV